VHSDGSVRAEAEQGAAVYSIFVSVNCAFLQRIDVVVRVAMRKDCILPDFERRGIECLLRHVGQDTFTTVNDSNNIERAWQVTVTK
jgi:hypothetical protein